MEKKVMDEFQEVYKNQSLMEEAVINMQHDIKNKIKPRYRCDRCGSHFRVEQEGDKDIFLCRNCRGPFRKRTKKNES